MKVALFKIFLFLSIVVNILPAQSIRVQNPEFDKKINRLISYKVPVLTVQEVNLDTVRAFIFLDAREKEEFNVSHIQNAKYVGYDNFNLSLLSDLSKDAPIIVYCSIGYRSDKIGGKLKEAGFTKVYNLYGSIFEWANQGFLIVDNNNQETLRLHTYNKKWSKWVNNPLIEKVW